MNLVKRQWSQEIERRLAQALGEGKGDIRRQCEAGQADVWEAEGRGLLVLRMDGDELVVVAAQGRGLVEVLAALIAKMKPATVRAHSARPGMGRLLKQIGFQYLETVYRWQNGKQQ